MTKPIPYLSNLVWEQVNDSEELHPGLTFQRFFVPKEGRNTEALNRVVKKSIMPFSSSLAKRVKNQIEWLRSTGRWAAEHFDERLDTRMAVGLGIPNPSENGLCLDHVHGIPYIPGSSLKGVCLDYALCEWEWERNRPECVAIFGAQAPEGGSQSTDFPARSGHVVFFDAMPVDGRSCLEIDIMNPHYGDYYQDMKDVPPADYLKPNPIDFLTVRAGTVFRFAMAARAASFEFDSETGKAVFEESACNLLSTAVNLLKDALCDLGVGAKTGVGYGLFDRERKP